MVYEGVGVRSGEVDWSRESFGGFCGRPDGFGSSDFTQHVDVLMFYRFMVSGTDFIKIMDFVAEEGSLFSPQQNEGINNFSEFVITHVILAIPA